MKTKKDILEWYLEAGVTETIGLLPLNRFNLPQEQILLKKEIHSEPLIATNPPPPDNLLSDALNRASKAQNEEELQKLLDSFEGCSLKKTAKNTIFGEGVSHPEILFVGEAPGADEDRTGRPFVGVSGKLLDKMMSSVGLSREKNSYITNIIPWRPPGCNRKPLCWRKPPSSHFLWLSQKEAEAVSRFLSAQTEVTAGQKETPAGNNSQR